MQMFVDGSWVASESGRTFAATSPATGEVIGQVPEGTRTDASRAVEAAHRARERMRSLGPFDRARLLHAGFQEMYERGFQAASVDRILERLAVTKAAVFHRFSTKMEFGCALVDETIASMIRAQWVDTLDAAGDPLPAIGDAFEAGVEILRSLP